MIEMINKLFGDTLWIYTGILGSLFGAAFLDQPDDSWRQKYPHVTKKIDELETRISKLEKKNGST